MSAPKTILYLHHSNDLYGADVMLLETVKGLDKMRYHPIVVLPDDCARIGPLSDELEKAGISFQFARLAIMRRKYLRGINPFGYCLEAAQAIVNLGRIIEEKDVELVHSNTLSVFAGAIAATSRGVPHVWHVHEMLVSPRVFRKGLHFAAAHMSDAIVCVSNAVRDHLLEDQPMAAGRVRVIPNGLSQDKFSVAGDGGAAFRRENAIPEHVPLIGMIGRLNHWKGQEVLVDAARLVIRQYPDAHFICVGSVFADEHHYLSSLTGRIASLKMTERFQILPFRRDIVEVLAAIDIYVHPSVLPEPFGLVVLEAMAAGKVVIASAHGGPVEMLEEGVTGYLVTPGDGAELADRIIRCLHEPDSGISMGIRARECALCMYKISRYLEEIQQLYDQVVAAEP